MDTFYKYWETCVQFIENEEIENAENFAKDIAYELTVSEDLINKIMSINLKSYEKKIEEKMNESIYRAKIEKAEALCLYYSIDNGWDSTIYICKNYTRENVEWISNSRSWIDVGKARGFSGIFKKDAESAFFTDEISSGICILIMLRTTIAFYNVAQKFKNCGLKLCVTCTDDDFVRVL